MEESYRIPEREAARVLSAAWTGMGAPATPDMFSALIRSLSSHRFGNQRAGDEEQMKKSAQEIAHCSNGLAFSTADGALTAIFGMGDAEDADRLSTISVSLTPTFANGLFDVCVAVYCGEEVAEMPQIVQFLAVIERYHTERQGLLVLAKAAIAAYREQVAHA